MIALDVSGQVINYVDNNKNGITYSELEIEHAIIHYLNVTEPDEKLDNYLGENLLLLEVEIENVRVRSDHPEIGIASGQVTKVIKGTYEESSIELYGCNVMFIDHSKARPRVSRIISSHMPWIVAGDKVLVKAYWETGDGALYGDCFSILAIIFIVEHEAEPRELYSELRYTIDKNFDYKDYSNNCNPYSSLNITRLKVE